MSYEVKTQQFTAYYENDQALKLHREDGPAFIYTNGDKEWWVNNKRHRNDGPAVEHTNGFKSWYKDGNLHNVGSPAVEFPTGRKEWFQNGSHHNPNGPAIQDPLNGISYMQDGFFHNIAGPAKILKKPDGTEVKEWWVNGRKFSTESELRNYMRDNVIKDYDAWNNIRYLKNGNYHNDIAPAIISTNGTKSWYHNGKRHRIDGPAVEHANGQKEWFQNGMRHRDNGPALEFADTSKQWFKNDKRHRLDGPAVEGSNGNKEWWVDGKAHRLNGPAIERVNGEKFWYVNGLQHRTDGPAIEYANGDKYWYQNNILHRIDGPAIERVGSYPNTISREWWVNGKRHREDGPAIEFADGKCQYWIDNSILTEEQFKIFTESKRKSEVKMTEAEKIHARRSLALEMQKNLKQGDYFFGSFARIATAFKQGGRIEPSTDERTYLRVQSEQTLAETIAKLQSAGITATFEGRGHEYNGRKHHMYLLKKGDLTYRVRAIVAPNDANLLDPLDKGCNVNSLAMNSAGQVFSLDPTVNAEQAVRDIIAGNFTANASCSPDVKQTMQSHGYKNVTPAPAAEPRREAPQPKKVELKTPAYEEEEDEDEEEEEEIPTLTQQRKQPAKIQTPATKVTTKEKPMENDFLDMMKREGEEAAYQVAATQIVNGTKAAITMAMKDDGMTPESMLSFEKFLDSEYGKGMISFMIGMGLRYAPVPFIQENEEAQRLAEKFRVNAMAGVGNKVIGVTMEKLVPVIMTALSTLPKAAKAENKIRVADKAPALAEKSMADEMDAAALEQVSVQEKKQAAVGQ